MWETHEEFPTTLADSWRKEMAATTVGELKAKLEDVSNHLVRWDKNTFGQVRMELCKLNEDLECMQQEP